MKKEPKEKTTKGRTEEGSKYYFLLVICAVGILIYSNTFDSPFQWDENDFLARNPIVKNLGYFLEPSKAKDLDPDYYFFLKTRYIGYLTFALNYQIHELRVWGYHLFNLAVHLLNGLLVYWLILLTFRTPFMEKSFFKQDSGLIALFSGLLFVSHPVQTEAVTYIFQRHASFVTFFYLSSLVYYIHWRLSLRDHELSRLRTTAFFVLSLFSTLLAMKTKENAFTLPFVILLYELFFFQGEIKRRLLSLIPWLLSLAVIPLTLKGIDRPIEWMIHSLDPSLSVYKDNYGEVYLFTQFRVILTYIRLLFLPIHQNLYYDYPVYVSFFLPQVFLPFLLHLAVLTIGACLVYRSKPANPDLRLIAFGIFWFFMTLAVESSIVPLPIIICEYRVYLPSVGWAVTVIASLWVLSERVKARFAGIRKMIMLSLALIVILFSALTYARNSIWRDEVRMWEDVTTKSPGNARAYYNLGLARVRQGAFERAMKEFQMTLKIDPHHAKAHNNLGLIYTRQGRVEDAVQEFQNALSTHPDDSNIHYNLGIAFGQGRRLDEAARAFQAALRLNPRDANAHNNLGVILGQQGRLEDAIRAFEGALKVDPGHVNAQNNLRKAYGKAGKANMENQRK